VRQELCLRMLRNPASLKGHERSCLSPWHNNFDGVLIGMNLATTMDENEKPRSRTEYFEFRQLAMSCADSPNNATLNPLLFDIILEGHFDVLGRIMSLFMFDVLLRMARVSGSTELCSWHYVFLLLGL
jgi:hypothetical protein